MPLDRSGTYLKIFVDSFQVDSSLPKFNEAITKAEKEIISYVKESSFAKGLTEEAIKDELKRNPDSLMNYISGSTSEEFKENYNKVELAIGKYKESKKLPIYLDSDELDKITDSTDLLIVHNQTKLVDRMRTNHGDILTNFMNWELVEGGIEKKKGKWKRWFEKFKRTLPKIEKSNLLDPLAFFKLVKLTSENSKKSYIERTGPYLAAIKRASDMGQKALVDQLLSGMFIAKYESILRAEGFDKAITEAQLVDFIKKTKKGVQLSYIKNFARNVPEEVLRVKKKADDLWVFDNYCVLYYDPEKKAYSMTAKEQEKERQRKADPILFGMILGSRKLYYITDWTDEWCDLTLEEFLKVSGLAGEDKIKIPLKI